jgi:hypothetical protein
MSSKHVIGNRRLRIIVANHLKAYVECPTRRAKSDLISRVADEIRLGCHGGGFVRREKGGCWVEVGPTISREKVSHAFRDSLLKNARRNRSPSPNQDEGNRQHTWIEAQDEIFSMLQLQSEPGNAQDPPGSNAASSVRASVQEVLRPEAAGIALLAGAAGTDLLVQPPGQLYTNLYQSQEQTRNRPQQRPLQQQWNQIQHQSDDSDDQISENLAYGDAFPWI